MSSGMSTPARPPRDVGRIILWNSLVLTVGSWVGRIANFLFMVYVVRGLGESEWGKYATVIAFAGLFGVFFEWGVTQYLQREVARDPSTAQDLFWNAVAFRLILALIGVLLISGLAFGFGYELSLVAGMFAFSCTFFLAAFLAPMEALLTGNERFDLATAVEITGQFLNILFAWLLLKLRLGFMALILANFIVMPIQIGMTAWLIQRSGIGWPSPRVRPGVWTLLFQRAFPFGFTSIALSFNYNIDTVILSRFHSTAVVGWYNVAYRLVFNFYSVVKGVYTALKPSMAREHAIDPKRVQRWVWSIVQLVALGSLPVAFTVSVLSPQLIALLYGEAYAPSARILQILIWDLPLVMFNALCGNITAAIRLERPAAWIYGISTAMGTVLYLTFIPAYGAQAAAIITVLADGICAVLFFLLLHQHLALGRITGRLVLTLGVAAAMGGIIWMLIPLGLLLAISLGIVGYGVLALAVGIVDWSVFQSAWRRWEAFRSGWGRGGTS